MRRLVVVLLLVATPAVARTVSRDRRYSFGIDVVEEREGVLRPIIVVWRRGRRAPIARIDANPGGGINYASFEVRFVGGHNLLASWGCGTYCVSSVLFTPSGRELTSGLGIHDVSPHGKLAVTYTAFDSPAGGDVAELIDLATGNTLTTSTQSGIWNTCAVDWQKVQVILVPCSPRTQPVALSIPDR